MILKTNDFKQVCKTILLAVDDYAASLELVAKNSSLYLNVTNKEYYVSTKFELNSVEEFRAVVDASLFLNLISGLTTDTFELDILSNTVIIRSGKSKYRAPMIYENDALMQLPIIALENKTVEMPIADSVLKSVLSVNSKELLKLKAAEKAKLDLNELQRLYYLTDEGCFTFVTGACLNKFTLQKPIKVLLNDRVVKLFKLFNEDVNFSFGYDQLSSGKVQSKIVLETPSIYLAAIVANDDSLLNKVQGPYMATKSFINEKYANSLVVSANALSAAISRLMLFTKNSFEKANMYAVMATLTVSDHELTITDGLDNSESIALENGSSVDASYTMKLNLFDLKLVLDSCKDEYITINCGNHRSVVISKGMISNIIPEGRND